MLKCPGCGRTGGPFRYRNQVHAGGQSIRAWSCPCGHNFFAPSGAEKVSGLQANYAGFTVDHGGRLYQVTLQQIMRHESTWSLGPWLFTITGPEAGPGTRTVAVQHQQRPDTGAQFRLQPEWGPGEILRRIRGAQIPPDLDVELVSRVLARIFG